MSAHESKDAVTEEQQGEMEPSLHRRNVSKAIKRPIAWYPPKESNLSRGEVFRLRRRAVEEYARYIGMNLRLDKGLLWLAEEGLYADLPAGYKEMKDFTGNPYYYNETTKTAAWEHPLDELYRKKYASMRSLHDSADPRVGKLRQSLNSTGLDQSTRSKKRSPVKSILRWLLLALTATSSVVLLHLLSKFSWCMSRRFRWEGSLLYQTAACFGSREALAKAGFSFYRGKDGIPQNSSLALEWFMEGAAMADAICQRMAGIMLLNGEGVDKDIERSRQLLHAAAQSHDIPAMAYLGFMYYTVREYQNFEAAVLWTKKSAEKGDLTGMFTYAIMFAEGKALTRDLSRACEWLLLVERHGSSDPAMTHKAKVYLSMLQGSIAPHEVPSRALSSFSDSH